MEDRQTDRRINDGNKITVDNMTIGYKGESITEQFMKHYKQSKQSSQTETSQDKQPIMKH